MPPVALAVAVIALLVVTRLAPRSGSSSCISAVFGAADALVLSGGDRRDPGDPSRRAARPGQRAQPHQRRPWRSCSSGRRSAGWPSLRSDTNGRFAIDAVSFAVSAGCVLAMSRRPRPEPSGHSPLADAREGLRYVRSQRWLWVSLAVCRTRRTSPRSRRSAVLVPLLIRNVLRQGPIALGLVLAAGGSRRRHARRSSWRGSARRACESRRCGSAMGRLGRRDRRALARAEHLDRRCERLSVVIAGSDATATCSGARSCRSWCRRNCSAARRRWTGWCRSSLSPLGVLVSGAAAGVIGTRATMLIGG